MLNVGQLIGIIYINADSAIKFCRCRRAMLDSATESIRMTLLHTTKDVIREVFDLSTYLQYRPRAKSNGGGRCKTDVDVDET